MGSKSSSAITREKTYVTGVIIFIILIPLKFKQYQLTSIKWLHEIKKFGLQIIMILRRNLINKFEIKIFILIRDAFLRDLGEVL